MKKNQMNQDFLATPVVRLYDIGPRIDFFPTQKPSPWSKIQKQLPALATVMVTVSLVVHLTVGGGAAIAVQQSGSSDTSPVTTEPVTLAGQPREALILTGQAVDLIGAESLSRGLSAQALLEEKGEISPTQAAETTPSQDTPPGPSGALAAPAETTADPTPTPAPVVAATEAGGLSKDQQSELVELSRSLIGVPYVLSGTTASGLDCSGFTRYIYDQVFGINLPHKASEQARTGTAVKSSNVRIGDILCFDWDGDGTVDHVGLYVGGGHYVNASRSRGEVCELVANFSSNPITTIRRIID